VEAYGHASIQHVITVLYRYNTVRNDFVDLKIMIKKYKDGDCDGFYFTNTTKNVRILVQRKKTGDTYGVIDFVYGDRPSDVIKTHVKENKLSTGDVLLKESINAIVRDMMKTAKINIPPNTQPISVFRNIDSLVEAGTTPEELLTKANRAGHSVSSRLNTYARVKQD
jgi:hypothetical protein